MDYQLFISRLTEKANPDNCGRNITCEEQDNNTIIIQNMIKNSTNPNILFSNTEYAKKRYIFCDLYMKALSGTLLDKRTSIEYYLNNIINNSKEYNENVILQTFLNEYNTVDFMKIKDWLKRAYIKIIKRSEYECVIRNLLQEVNNKIVLHYKTKTETYNIIHNNIFHINGLNSIIIDYIFDF